MRIYKADAASQCVVVYAFVITNKSAAVNYFTGTDEITYTIRPLESRWDSQVLSLLNM